MSRRSQVPPSFDGAGQQQFLDDLWKRRRSAIADLPSTASSAEIAAKINEILQADRSSGQQDA